MNRFMVLLVSTLAFTAIILPPISSAALPKAVTKAVEEGKKLVEEAKKLKDDRKTTEKNLATYENFDLTVFSGQDWARLKESHSENVVVHWPDGRETTGLAKHLEDLKAFFVFAPDTAIKAHTAKFGSDGLTATTGVMTGTFTKPMPVGEGRVIQPTGRAFSLPLCAVCQWKGGDIVEKWLYWDNQTFSRQLGVP